MRLSVFSTIKSLAGFQLFVPDTPRTDHGEDEEYITFEATLQRSTIRRCQAEVHEDLISQSAYLLSLKQLDAETYQ